MFVKQIALPVTRIKSLNKIISRTVSIINTVPCCNSTIKKSSNFLSKHTLASNLSNLQQKHQQSSVNYSRFSATTIMSGTELFKISDYDYVGFDLDNTLLQYKVSAMVELEYKTLSNYMVNVKGYSEKHLLQPLDIDFLQKGLIVDIHRGNLLKISCDGYILKATHGTKFLSDSEISDVYGPERMWEVTTEFTRNILVSWIGQYADTIRCLADYFDMPSSLVFARCVDSLDEKAGGKKLDSYKIWPDVLDGLIHMYTRENFESGVSAYFKEIRANPQLYIHRTKPEVIKFLKKLKEEKTTFLITGSNIDLANLTAAYCLGEDWRELFDMVVCFAKKPGFFNASRPFVKIEGVKETVPMDPNDLELNQVYSQGNWVDLDFALSKKRAIKNPKMLYFGDNIIQDVYAPTKYTTYDSVAIVEELLAEGMKDIRETHADKELLTSSLWGPYFGTSIHPTIWSEIIREHSKICVPNVDTVAKNPIDFEYKSPVNDRVGMDFIQTNRIIGQIKYKRSSFTHPVPVQAIFNSPFLCGKKSCENV